MLDKIFNNIPVVSQAYGFAKTAQKVYNCTTPAGAVATAVKGIVLDCSPPVVKYPLKCSILTLQFILIVTSGGNPMTVSLFIGMLENTISDL